MRRPPHARAFLGLALAVAAGATSSCTALLGIDADYRAENDGDSDAVAGDAEAGPAAEGGPPESAPPPDAGSDAFPANPGAIAEVTAGQFHTCVRFETGVAMCWGRAEDYGELGNGTLANTSVAEPAMGAGIVHLFAGEHDTCAVLADGAACAGKGGAGELLDDVGDADSPVPVAETVLPASPKAIASGLAFTCALLSTGDVVCVGDGTSGTLGNGGGGISLEPVPIDLGGEQASAIAARNVHACAVLADGTVTCWGDGASGPASVQGLPGAAVAVCTGDDFSCALVGNDENSTVWCWGDNSGGELGNGDPGVSSSSTPVKVKGLAGAASLTCGSEHACAGTEYANPGIWCWGKGGSGQLGNEDTSNAYTPVQVSGISAYPESLAAGGFHTCAILSSPNVLCWGSNDFGQLGDDSPDASSGPVSVTGIP
ncbi:MAG TPA: hypothetical protein VGG39_11230 [Polyangiaceae bacterium]|jgi:alpha-tubulin suppressor-like RCC1 family protein